MGIFNKKPKQKDKTKKLESIKDQETIKENISGQITFEEYKKNCEEQEDYAPGWEAIDRAFSNVYGKQEPNHFGTIVTSRAIFGGPEFLDGYSIYQSTKGYYHIVTYGMSQLYGDIEKYGEEYSKWGYEMTFKLKANSVEECHFAMNMLGNLARYTYQSGKYFLENEYVLGNGDSIKLDSDSKICSLLIVKDTEIPMQNTVHGKLEFLQLIGITYEDAKKIHEIGTRGYVEEVLGIIRKDNPNLVTDLENSKQYL